MKTKRNYWLATFILAFVLNINLSAQEQIFNKSDIDLNVGIGFGSTWSGSGYMVVPPISATIDYALRDDWGPGVFGVGAYLGTSVYSTRINTGVYDYGYRYSTFIIGARATYHYSFLDKLDTYGGALLGVRITREKPVGDWTGISGIESDGGIFPVPAVFVGAKYYFSDNFAVYNELSYGIAFFTIGATFKF